MTLLLNLIGPQGIHQSSDFRLTEVTTRRPIEDEFGSKQVEYLAATWIENISFTGFAQIGSRKTRDWILESFGRSDGFPDPPTAFTDLAEKAAAELRRVPQKDWFLTIVATVRENSRPIRLFVVSCIDRPGKTPLSHPLDHFEVYELSAVTPRELIFGRVDTVTHADRKYLKQLNRGTADQAEIRRALAAINARSARISNGTVSEGCLVSSTMPDGSTTFENFGKTPGVPVDIAGSAEMADVIARAQKGGRSALIQGRSATTKNVKEFTFEPMNVTKGSTLVVKSRSDAAALFVTDSSGNTFRAVGSRPNAIDQDAEWAKLEEGKPAGPAHTVAYSSSSHSITFNGPDGSKFGVMEISRITGEAVVMKNRASKTTLATVAVRALPAFKHQAQPLKTSWYVNSCPTIDGVQPHEWSYTVDMLLDASGAELSIQQNSVALRSVNFPSPLSGVTDSEELILVSSMRPATIKISKDQPSASANIEARLFVREIPKAMAASGQPGAMRTNPKVGRNNPCPCGSGLKYKKCCLNKL